MAKKKNKKAKKPAVGKPAAGSNNKGAKKAPSKGKKPQQKNAKPPYKGSKPQQKNAKQQTKSAAKSNQKVKSAPKKVEKTKKQTPKKSAIDFDKLNQKFSAFSKKVKAFADKCKKNYDMKKVFIAVGFIVAVIAVTAIVIALIANNNYSVPDYVKNADYKGRVESEAIAFDMDISENQQKALAKSTKSKGDKRKFDFFVNDTIVMNEYDDPALIEFGSADSNDCVLVFYILDENGQELYRSLGIEPGRQVRSISFFDEIPYGTQDVTIAVLGYDAKTYKSVGMQTAQIKLEIGVD
ncbi:MAG: hypothetical protein MJ120_03975 [Clostridia bacterium]|nr:hypothetical protein [Clostridia bacterium]